MRHVAIVGLGYVGKRLKKRCLDKGYEVCLLSRDKLDLDKTDTRLDVSFGGMDVVYLVPPFSQGKEDVRVITFINQLKEKPKSIIYFGTTGVYGDCKGEWVTENSELKAKNDNELRRISAENFFKNYANQNNIPLTILRVAGIYGPGRLPVERVKEKKPIVILEESSISNRIHVDDLVEVTLKAIENAKGCHVYNVSDGNPQPMSQLYINLAKILEVDEPPQVPLEKVLKDVLIV